jgi:hypothetical protein
LAVLADLISDTPKLLKRETVEAAFAPQFKTEGASSPLQTMKQRSWLYQWFTIGDAQAEEAKFNHGLAGALLQSEVAGWGQPVGPFLTWAGATSCAWFASRELGMAGLFMVQTAVPASPAVQEFYSAWKKDLWATWASTKSK